ncbi:hypothetical protein [Arthrobacter sp. ZGTC212]|uniref:hypothetical protein n=1 Tax=Arthrobacter sp. ZGTC212 TaxID=2058899 RepID=UPI0015E23526|nr:hypothetical protein [Arthrobacter sp. ZGTC212]
MDNEHSRSSIRTRAGICISFKTGHLDRRPGVANSSTEFEYTVTASGWTANG